MPFARPHSAAIQTSPRRARAGLIVLALLAWAMVGAVVTGASPTWAGVSAPPSQCDAVAGNIVHNCGFETGDLGAWTLVDESAQSIQAGVQHSGSYSDTDGTVGSPDDLSQTLTDAQPGGVYALTFYARYPSGGSPGESFEVTADNVETAGHTVGSVTLFTDGGADPITDSYQPFTAEFTVPTTAETVLHPVLHFRIQNNPSFYYLDDVSAVFQHSTNPPPPTQPTTSLIEVAVAPDPANADDPVTATATVHPQFATGNVQFSLDGSNVGAPVPLDGPDNSASITLPGPLSAGKHLVGATYSGDATYPGSFNNYQFSVNPPDVVNPTISAAALSGHPKTSAGWYRSPVAVFYHCTEGSAPFDANGCPDAVGISDDGSHTLSRTVTATDGGAATDTTTVNLDQTDPFLQINGVTAGKTYKHPRTIRCAAADPLSGLAAPCVVTTHKHHHKVHYKATVTDNAGNTTKQKGHYTLS